VPSGARISVEPRAESRTGNDGSRFAEIYNLYAVQSRSAKINGPPFCSLSKLILFDRPVCAFSQPNGARPVDARRAFYSSRLENVGLFISRRRSFSEKQEKAKSGWTRMWLRSRHSSRAATGARSVQGSL
jgi:hypothetical protein